MNYLGIVLPRPRRSLGMGRPNLCGFSRSKETILLVGGAIGAMSAPSYAQDYEGYNYPPPPQDPYATPWVGSNTELFALFERDRRLIPPGDLHELRFEDLEKSPPDCLANLYQGLSLPDFERFWQQASVYLDSIAGYKKHLHLDGRGSG
jgi:hypothetical protein